MSLKSLLHPEYFHFSFSIIITAPCLTCADLTLQGYGGFLRVVPWPCCLMGRKAAQAMFPLVPTAAGQSHGFSFYSLTGNDLGSSQPPSVLRSSDADLKAYIWARWVWKILSNNNPLVRPTVIREHLTKSADRVNWKVLSPGVTPRWKETCYCQ